MRVTIVSIINDQRTSKEVEQLHRHGLTVTVCKPSYLLRSKRAYNADYYHCHRPLPLMIFTWLFAKLRRAKFFADYNDIINHHLAVERRIEIFKKDAKLDKLQNPTAPHLAEELWQKREKEYSIHNQSWPQWDDALAKDEEVTLVVQVNGKLRDRIAVPVSISETEARELAMSQQRVQAHVEGREIVNIIYVPGRFINLVVK